MKFSYKQLGTDGAGRDVIRPIIPVTLRSGERAISYEVLVDSGADRNIFDAEIAELLGLELTAGEKGHFQGVTGAREVFYTHEIDIEVGGWTYATTASFAKLPDAAHGIVGQRGFFEFFTVKFQYRKERVELKRNPPR